MCQSAAPRLAAETELEQSRRFGHGRNQAYPRNNFRTRLRTVLLSAVMLRAGAAPHPLPRVAIRPVPFETVVPIFLDSVRRPESSSRTGRALAA